MKRLLLFLILVFLFMSCGKTLQKEWSEEFEKREEINKINSEMIAFFTDIKRLFPKDKQGEIGQYMIDTGTEIIKERDENLTSVFQAIEKSKNKESYKENMFDIYRYTTALATSIKINDLIEKLDLENDEKEKIKTKWIILSYALRTDEKYSELTEGKTAMDEFFLRGAISQNMEKILDVDNANFKEKMVQIIYKLKLEGINFENQNK